MNTETLHEINGTKVFSLTNPHLHTFCIGLYFRAGSMYEPPELSGITHMFEHTVFRNIKKKYGGRLYELLSENGLRFNACTYKEFLCFSVTGLPTGLRLGADILLSVFDSLTVGAGEYAAEKQRVLAEIREDDDARSLRCFADKAAWNGVVLARTISGTQTSVRRISLSKIRSFGASVTKQNRFICVTGNVSVEDERYLLDRIGLLPACTGMGPWENDAPVPAAFGSRSYRLNVLKADYFRTHISFDIPQGVCPVEIRDLLYALLFADDDAMLNTELSENAGLIYSYDSFLEQYNNVSRVAFSYETDKHSLPQALERAFSVLRRVKRGEFPFDRTLKKTLTPLYLELDNAEDLNWTLAYENHILQGRPLEHAAPLFGRYEGVAKEDMTRCAGRIFVPQNLVLAFKGERDYLRRLDIASLIGSLSADS